MRENARRRLEKMPTGYFADLTLHRDRITKGGETQPLAGVTARVEAGSDLKKRVTATRLVALGVFAFAAKKKTGGEVFLTIEGPEFFWTVEVDRKKRGDAQAFAAKVNDQARKVSAGT